MDDDRPTSVVEFYDGLADEYHLVYGDHWQQALRRQGEVLDGLIGSRLPTARSVLDCSCGIGTQAIGLLLRGYQVTGTDVSAQSLTRASETARELDVSLRVSTADFRDLTAIPDGFDVVISCDNAIPHLLSDADVDRALGQMRSRLRPDGLLMISVRDYDQALVQRPRTALPLEIPGSPRRIVVRLHEWDAPDSPLYTVRLLILTEAASGWMVNEHATRYRALPRRSLLDAARRAGLTNIEWLPAAETSFHQPLLIARAPERSRGKVLP